MIGRIDKPAIPCYNTCVLIHIVQFAQRKRKGDGYALGGISVDYRSRKPIYEQLVENIRNLVLKGLLKPSEILPSVRALAGELGINPNTIQKAYAELERQGIIVTIPGKGSAVCEDISCLSEQEKTTVLRELRGCVERARELNVPKKEILIIVDTVMQGEVGA